MAYNSIGEGSSSSARKPLIDKKGKDKYTADQTYPSHEEGEEEEEAINTSLSYGAISSNSYQNNNNINNSRSQKTCTYITIITTACCILVLFCLLWFAPKFAERSVKDGIGFNFQKASILNVTDDNIITMHVMGKIELTPTLFNLQKKINTLFGKIGIQDSTLQVHYEQESKSNKQQEDISLDASSLSIGFIDLPALNLNSTSHVTAFDFITQFMIDDTDALMEFCKDAVIAKTIMWRVTGPLSVGLGWLPFHSNIILDKTVGLEGMDGLKKTNLQSILFPGPHPLGGIEVSGQVGIYNPSSVLSLSLGNMDFGIFLPALTPEEKDLQIAVVQAKNADLQGHHMNYFEVSGRTMPIPSNDSKSQQLMDLFLTNYLHGNSTKVHVCGSEFGPNDKISISTTTTTTTTTPRWLRKALQSIVLSVPFPGASETDLIQSLELSNIKIDFSRSGRLLISGDALAILKKPEEMQFHMDVTQIHPTVFLFLNKNSTKPFATVKPEEPCPAKTEEGNGINLPLGKMKVISTLSRAPFKVLPNGQKDFEEFLDRVFHQRKGRVYIKGTSDATVESAFGHLNVHDLAFNGEIETQGLEGMQHPPPKVKSLSIIAGYNEALLANTEIEIYSPSNVNINLGELNLYLLFNGHIIGNTTIPDFILAPHVYNNLTVSAWLFGNDEHVIDFIGQYISNGIHSLNNATLTISGQHPNATKSRFLNNFIKHLTFDVQIPPFDKDPLLADCQMNILSSTVVMSLRNPFPGVLMTINKINASATYQVYEIGRMEANFEDRGEGWKGPVLLPPPHCDDDHCKGVIINSEKIPVMTKKLGYDAIKKALGGSIIVSVESQVSVMIDDFKLNDLQYHQSNITTKVRKRF